MQGTNVEKLLVDRREAATMLSVSKRTLDHLIVLGQVKTVRIGRRVLIPRQSLERIAASRCVQTRQFVQAAAR